MKNFITAVVLTNWECTLNCAYCYARATRKDNSAFNEEKLRQLVFNCSSGFDSVEFCWLGGEPLLVGESFYRVAIEAQQFLSKLRNVHFKNVVQTNGTLITEQWLEFFEENNFSFGLSIDAPLEIHLKQRPHISQIMTATDWEKIWTLVRHFKGSFGCLCVISKLNVGYAKEIFDFFKVIGATTYSLIPLKKMPIPECPEAPTNEEVAKLYCDTFDLWMNSPNGFTSIEPLETMIRGLLGERPLLCSFTARCLKKMITIDPYGNVAHCSALVQDDFLLGNIFNENLINIINNQKTKELRKRRELAIRTHCCGCDYLPICRGGCRNTTFWNENSYDARYAYCKSRKITFDYLRKRLQHILNPTC